MIDCSDRIKDAVSMMDICHQYGLPVNRGGFTNCPFHGEKTASLKVFNAPGRKGWYCYGCHQGGSVIDFVQRFFGLDFFGAVKKINLDFNLGLPIDSELTAEQQKQQRIIAYQRRKRETERQKQHDRLRTAYDRALANYARLDKEAQIARSAANPAALTDSMVYALTHVDAAWYELCEAQTALSAFENSSRQ